MSLVIDSSITLAWYFIDEQTPGSLTVLAHVSNSGATVPALWKFEVANGLQMAVRRKRVDGDFRDRALGHLGSLSVVTDVESEAHLWSATVKLAERHALTIYDAAYLELAQRRRIPLATLDKALQRAASSEAVPVLGAD